MKSDFVAFTFLALSIAFALGQEEAVLPREALDLIAKLQEFEQTERDKFEATVADKRQAVAVALKKYLERETKDGNLETALALKKLIGELEKNTLTLKPPVVESGGKEFAEWVRRIEIHDQAGWWEIVEDQLVQHIGDNGGVRRFACVIDGPKSQVSFGANGRTYFFKFLSDRTMGIRSADDEWPEQLFSVKPRR